MAYSDKVLADSPAMYLRLNEASGTSAADSSGNGRSGVHSGSLTAGAAGLVVTDPGGKSVDYSGGSTAVGNGTWLDSAVYTTECIIRPDALGLRYFFMRNYNDAVGNRSWRWIIYDSGGGAHKFALSHYQSDGNEIQVSSSTILSAGTTYHLAGTYDGTTMRMYVNGVQEASAAATAMATTWVGVTVGSLGNGGSPFDGRIDEVAYYSSALSAGRISAHYSALTRLDHMGWGSPIL